MSVRCDDTAKAHLTSSTDDKDLSIVNSQAASGGYTTPKETDKHKTDRDKAIQEHTYYNREGLEQGDTEAKGKREGKDDREEAVIFKANSCYVTDGVSDEQDKIADVPHGKNANGTYMYTYGHFKLEGRHREEK